MGKYSSYARHSEKKPMVIHPIWRGIGFIMMILSPVLAYFSTMVLLDRNILQQWFKIPSDLLSRGADPYLYIKIISTAIIVFLLYVFFMIITFIIYRILGPVRFGPQDAPPRAFRGKTYRR